MAATTLPTTATREQPARPRAERPDALLLDAFDNWIAVCRADNEALALPGCDNRDTRPLKIAADQAERAIERLPAYTAAGVAAKLKFLLYAYTCDLAEMSEAFFRGEPIVDQVIAEGDWRDVVLVRVLQDVERRAARERLAA